MHLPRTPSMRLDGRRALVTGAGRGIGLAAAAALAQAGAEVTLAARTEAEITAAAEAIEAEGGRATWTLTARDLQIQTADRDRAVGQFQRQPGQSQCRRARGRRGLCRRARGNGGTGRVSGTVHAMSSLAGALAGAVLVRRTGGVGTLSLPAAAAPPAAGS